MLSASAWCMHMHTIGCLTVGARAYTRPCAQNRKAVDEVIAGQLKTAAVILVPTKHTTAYLLPKVLPCVLHGRCCCHLPVLITAIAPAPDLLLKPCIYAYRPRQQQWWKLLWCMLQQMKPVVVLSCHTAITDPSDTRLRLPIPPNINILKYLRYSLWDGQGYDDVSASSTCTAVSCDTGITPAFEGHVMHHSLVLTVTFTPASSRPFELPQYNMLNTDEQQELNRLRDKYKVSINQTWTADGQLHYLSTVTTMIPPLTDGLTCCASTGWSWRTRHPWLAGRRYGHLLASCGLCPAGRWPLTAQLPAGAAKQAVSAADDKLAHVHLCHSCQGRGVHTEVYEFRRLEVSHRPMTLSWCAGTICHGA
jgi:hypothetical protein